METNSNIDRPDLLTIEVPSAGITDRALLNLRKILAIKGPLIKKALEADNLNIEVGDDVIKFPWFARIPEPNEVLAYSNFIASIVSMARNQTRVNSTDRGAVNEKYAFRCFLIKLGMIGDQYKEIRRILLKNLSGSSAFKSGIRPSAADDNKE